MRQKAVSDETEFKKRETYMKEQWLRDLQDKEKSEEEWEGKIEVLTHRLKERDDTLNEKEVVLRERESTIKLHEETLKGKGLVFD